MAAWESEPIALRVLPGGGAEQAPDDWWRALVAATRRLLARHNGPASDIAAVCCSTQGEGAVPVDRDGRALMGCTLWMDMRAAPHLLLVRDAFPEVYERTYKFLNVLDYLNLRLTGRFVATFDSILTSWIADNRDADDVKYDPSLVRGCAIDADKLPEIVKCTEVLGPLTTAAAEALGPAPGTQVAAGVEIRQVRDQIQANARAAALIAAAGLGEIGFADVPELVELEHVFEPQTGDRAVYDERYQTFLEIHKRMRPLYRRVNRDSPLQPGGVRGAT